MAGISGGMRELSARKGLTEEMLHGSIGSSRITGVFSRDMMRIAFNHQPTARPSGGSCLAQGFDRLAVKVWSISGRTTE
jgi:hypothetical protein